MGRQRGRENVGMQRSNIDSVTERRLLRATLAIGRQGAKRSVPASVTRERIRTLYCHYTDQIMRRMLLKCLQEFLVKKQRVDPDLISSLNPHDLTFIIIIFDLTFVGN